MQPPCEREHRVTQRNGTFSVLHGTRSLWERTQRVTQRNGTFSVLHGTGVWNKAAQDCFIRRLVKAARCGHTWLWSLLLRHSLYHVSLWVTAAGWVLTHFHSSGPLKTPILRARYTDMWPETGEDGPSPHCSSVVWGTGRCRHRPLGGWWNNRRHGAGSSWSIAKPVL